MYKRSQYMHSICGEVNNIEKKIRLRKNIYRERNMYISDKGRRRRRKGRRERKKEEEREKIEEKEEERVKKKNEWEEQ